MAKKQLRKRGDLVRIALDSVPGIPEALHGVTLKVRHIGPATARRWSLRVRKIQAECKARPGASFDAEGNIRFDDQGLEDFCALALEALRATGAELEGLEHEFEDHIEEIERLDIAKDVFGRLVDSQALSEGETFLSAS